MHQVRGKGGSAFLVVRQDTASTVQAVHFKDKENPEDSKRWVWVCGLGERPDHCCRGGLSASWLRHGACFVKSRCKGSERFGKSTPEAQHDHESIVMGEPLVNANRKNYPRLEYAATGRDLLEHVTAPVSQGVATTSVSRLKGMLIR